MAKSSRTKYVNVMLQNASNMEKIPLMDIKVESITDQPTCHSEIINQKRSVIADIIKNIMYSLDLLIKSDPDNVRSANVRDKIIAVLFTYQNFMDDKALNMASYKEVDIFDDCNNIKEIDVVYNEDEEENNSDDFNLSSDDLLYDIDDNMEDSIISNLRKKETILIKDITVKVKTKKGSKKPKLAKKIKKKPAKRTKTKEVDIFNNRNNLKEIDIVCNDSEDSNLSDDDDSYKPSDDSDIDDSIEELLSNIKNKEANVAKNIKKVKANRKTQSKKFKPTKEMTRASKNSEIVNIDDDSNTLRDVDIVYNEDSDSVDSNISIDIDTDGNDSYNDIEDSVEDEIIAQLMKEEANLMKDIEEVEAKQKATSDKHKMVKKLKDTAVVNKKGNIKRRVLTMGKKTEEIVIVNEGVSHNDLPVKTEYSKDNIGFVSAVPRYVCDICDVTVISEHHLTVHKHLCKMRHYYYGNPLLEEYWSDLKCPLCDVTCTHRGNLPRHYTAHKIKDIESAFEFSEDKKHSRDDPKDNMKLFNDFIAGLERKDKVEKSIETVPALIQHSGNIESTIQDSSDTNHKKAELTDISKKPSIDDFVKFNLRKVVYDVDINKKLYCYPCDILFNSKDELEEHRKKLNNTDVFVCNHCDKTFDTPLKVVSHTKYHKGLYNPKSLYLNYKPEETEGCPRQIDYKIYVCKYCLGIYSQECALRSHFRHFIKYGRCHGKREWTSGVVRLKTEKKNRMKPPPGIKQNADGKLQCNQCDKSYAIYHCFKEHLASHSKIFQYQCECGKGFKSKVRLRHHIKVVHAKQFQAVCEVCGIKVSRLNLKRHMKVHSDLRPYKCSYCNKSFRFKEGLIAHTRTHTHERPWKCKYCEMTFSESRYYKIHMNIHEGKTPFKCDQCPSAFVSKMELKKHSLDHIDCRNSL